MSEWTNLGLRHGHHDAEVRRESGIGFYVREPHAIGEGFYVSKPSVPDLVAWLRKEYPEHFAAPSVDAPNAALVAELRAARKVAAEGRDLMFTLNEPAYRALIAAGAPDNAVYRWPTRAPRADVLAVFDRAIATASGVAAQHAIRGTGSLDGFRPGSTSSAASCVDVRAKVTLDGLDEIQAASREIAEHLERAASAMQRIRSER